MGITYLARPGEKVVIDDELQIISKGLQCTTQRPVKTVIKGSGKNELEDSFKRDAERTEKWLNNYHQAKGEKEHEEPTDSRRNSTKSSPPNEENINNDSEMITSEADDLTDATNNEI